MKKITKSIFTAMAVLMTATAAVGCVGGGGNSDIFDASGNKIDTSKTQLWIYNMENAMGSAWLDSLIDKFEAKYESKEFSNGTTGIEVHTFGKREPLNTLTLSTQPYQIVLTENEGPMHIHGNQTFYDMSAWVKETNAEDGKSIESKLTDEWKEGLTAHGGYYVLPTFDTYATPTYNRHLFDASGLYFADSVEELYANGGAPAKTDAKYGLLLKNKTAKKSCGPDGLYNTEDDGLPSSVEEMKQLVTCMVDLGMTPFVAYASTYHYTNKMLLSMYATLEGADGVRLFLSGDSQKYGSTEIVVLDDNGKVVKENGLPKTETFTFSEHSENSNGYLISRQASKYYALDLYEHIFNKDRIDFYYDVDGLSSTTSHTDVQRRFLESEISSKGKVGFLMDGSYWENESKDAGNLNRIKDIDPDYYEEMDYRLYHLPTQYKGRVQAVGEVGEDGNVTYYEGKTEADVKKQVLVSNVVNYAYINRAALLGIDGKIDPSVEEATKLFVQYMYTDANLSASTALTGIKNPMNYEIAENDYAKMSAYAKNVWDLSKSADVVWPVVNTNYYKNNTDAFSVTFQGADDLFVSLKNGDQVRWPLNGFRQAMTLDEYFEGMAKARGETWWKSLKF